jgi:glycosyltransferase involved in cell wall biosynthesis
MGTNHFLSRLRAFFQADKGGDTGGKKVVYFTRFVPTWDAGGGCRRMMQVRDIFDEVDHDYDMISALRQDRLSQAAVRRISRHALQANDGEHRLWNRQHRQYVRRLYQTSREWCRSVDEIPNLKLAILDDPIYFLPLLDELKRHDVPVIATCQNIESLAPDQVEPDPARSLFHQEIDGLAQCDLVIAISREETFLLRNLGVHAEYVPYYPVEQILNRLLQIRERRKTANKQGILLLGNAANQPSCQGMEQAIAFWESADLFRQEGKLLVAGYYTEQYLRVSCQQHEAGVEFLGTLTDEELDECLSHAKACLCFQESGAGALTRICEMAIAGVPVLANPHAARSYYNMPGVIEFRDLNGLEKAIRQIDEVASSIPVPPPPDTSFVISEMKRTMRP